MPLGDWFKDLLEEAERYQTPKVSYAVVTSSSSTELAQKVNELAQQGYIPHGSLAVTPTTIYQPMIKYD